MIHFQFTTQYGKFVCMSITVDRYGEYAVQGLMINDNVYTKKHIRTQWRNDTIIAYAEANGLELRREYEEPHKYE